MFRGKKYFVKPAKLGVKVARGNVVKTALGGSVRLVFPNGDTINVGPGTAVKMQWKKRSPQSKDSNGSLLNIIYGKMRTNVSQNGPRRDLKVISRGVVAGVRGTDFHVSFLPAVDELKLAVLRGKVALKAEPKAEPQVVPAGFKVEAKLPKPLPAPLPRVLASKPELETTDGPGSAAPAKKELEPPIPPAPPKPVVFKVMRTTRTDLLQVQRTSHVPKKELEKVQKQLPVEVKREIQSLETKALETALKEVQKEQPELFATLKDRPPESATELSSAVVVDMLKTAPPGKEAKPTMEEFRDLEQEVFEKYYND